MSKRRLSRDVKIGNRTIGDGHPCFIVYEAGPTHDSLASAKRLVDLTANAKADAIKFQVVDPDRLVADRKQLFTYDILKSRETGETETVNESLYEILCRRTLEPAEWRELKAYCDEKDLAFFATVSFDDQVDMLIELGCHSIKIASADVNFLPMLRYVASTGTCIQLDTGNSTLGEIETAVDTILAEGNDQVIIHQCPSGYPARLESINLRTIPTLKQMFGAPAAYSDHTPGWDMDIAALTIGANLIEKTITEDRTTPSVEHIMSLEPPQIDQFVNVMRDVEIALGESRRFMSAEEKIKRDAVRRSVFLAADTKAETRLGDATIEFRRPGHGLSPDMYEMLLDMKIGADLPAGHMLSLSDLIAR